jgi:hypothetical protein
MFRFLFAVLLLLTLPVTSFAGRLEAKGVGTHTIKGGFFVSQPSNEERQAAIEDAKANAWKKLVAGFNRAKQTLISENETELLNNLDVFILDVIPIDTQIDSKSKSFKVVVRVAFNDDAVNLFLDKLSQSKAQQDGTKDKNALFTFLFMARTALPGTDGTLKYLVSGSEDMDSAISEVILTSGFEYVSYDDVVGTCEGLPAQEFRQEFVKSDEMYPKTRHFVIMTARNCGVRYFAYGTLDNGVADIDPVSGNRRVFVSVRAQLWDISQRLPRKIASVGPKQYSGLGSDPIVASRNAVLQAAHDIGRTLVDQLNAKRVH